MAEKKRYELISNKLTRLKEEIRKKWGETLTECRNNLQDALAAYFTLELLVAQEAWERAGFDSLYIDLKNDSQFSIPQEIRDKAVREAAKTARETFKRMGYSSEDDRVDRDVFKIIWKQRDKNDPKTKPS